MKNIFLLCLSLLSAQMKEWQSVSCEFQDINWSDNIWGMETGDSRYILAVTNDNNRGLFQFKATGNNATCTLTDKRTFQCYACENPYLENETTAYDQRNDSNFVKSDLQSGYYTFYTSKDLKMSYKECQCFLMESKHYCLHYKNKKLYRFTLNNTDTSITAKELTTLDPASIDADKHSANVVVLNNKFYYLSEAGFCEVTVSGDTTSSKLILKIDADAIDDTIKKSILVTDKKNRVWIINNTHGVQEYNSETGKIQKIAEAPQIRERLNCYQVCFYLNDTLYYINNEIA